MFYREFKKLKIKSALRHVNGANPEIRRACCNEVKAGNPKFEVRSLKSKIEIEVGN